MQIGKTVRINQPGIARLLTMAALVPAISGCGNTLSGAKQDITANTQKAVDSTRDISARTTAAARKAGQAIKSVPENAGAAVAVTPEIKIAILRDPVLNDPKNLINVQSEDHETHLTGHVLTERMKQRAEEDAQEVLAKRHPDYKIVNELAIEGG